MTEPPDIHVIGADRGIEVTIVISAAAWDSPEEAEARERAEALLWENLDPLQRHDYKSNNAFNVMGSDGRRYRITNALNYNVTSDIGQTLCAIPKTWRIPHPDMLLAQKLWIEANAPGFLATAFKGSFHPKLTPRSYPPLRPRQFVDLASRRAGVVSFVGFTFLGVFSMCFSLLTLIA